MWVRRKKNVLSYASKCLIGSTVEEAIWMVKFRDRWTQKWNDCSQNVSCSVGLNIPQIRRSWLIKVSWFYNSKTREQCWWLPDCDNFKMSVNIIANRSPTFRNCRQHELSLRSVTNIDSTKTKPKLYILPSIFANEPVNNKLKSRHFRFAFQLLANHIQKVNKSFFHFICTKIIFSRSFDQLLIVPVSFWSV